MAAVVSEADIPKLWESANNIPVVPEMLVPRLGEYLVENDFLQAEQLSAALTYQRENNSAARPLLLGQALLELNLIERETLDQAVTEQIYQLQDALRKSNQQLEQRVQEHTAELRAALDRLTELNQLKTNFVSNLSHELRTPLAHMIGYIDMLNSGTLGPLSAEQASAVSVLDKSYYRLQALIDNLLLFSLASEGQLVINRLPLPVIPLVKSVAGQSQKKAQAQDITLVTNCPQTAVKVMVDGEKINWVLLQMVDNAIKFNNPGGKVEIGASLNGEHVTLGVTDNGVGIPENKYNEIFESFHQLDGSSSRKYGGTGLGLSLAQRIVIEHGSQIKVTSKVGQGSRFEFSLPILEAAR